MSLTDPVPGPVPSPEYVQAMLQVIELEIVPAWRALGESLALACTVWAENLRIVFGPILRELGFYDEAEVEQALRKYAADYNWRHQNRKVSWRRLNRVQRQEAMGQLKLNADALN